MNRRLRLHGYAANTNEVSFDIEEEEKHDATSLHSEKPLSLSYEVMQIESSINYVDKDDVIIWKFNSSDIYSVQFLYAIINDRCETNIHPCDVENHCST
jgi:hypothetical protein